MIGALIFGLFGVIFLAAGGVMLYFRRRMQGQSALMQGTQTSLAADVSDLAPGTLVEVKGTLRCDKPLKSELAEEPCAYYVSEVIREYTEPDHDDNDSGSDRRSETLSQSEQFAPFFVEDTSGRVEVDAETAEMDARQVVDRFERDTSGSGLSLSLGGTTLNFGGGEHTLGYRYSESILPVDDPVYVLGTVRQDGKIGESETGDREHRFVVSYRSEEALGKSLGSNALWLALGAAGAFVLGIVFLLIAILVPMS